MELSEEVRALRAGVQRFLEAEVEPRSRWIDEEDRIPPELLEKARELGLFGLTVPECYGGVGLDVIGKCALEEEFGRSNYGFATLIGNHTGISCSGIVEHGTEAQRAKYLPRMASGEWIACFCLTEAQAGSDPSGMRASAVKRGDRWILNGEKIYITNAPEAYVFTVMAVTAESKGVKGISAFIVERDFPGLAVGRNEKKMGMHGAHAATVTFTDCEVPAENLLGEEGLGYIQALRALTRGRVTLAARCLGMMERLLGLSVGYAKLREQGGRRIADHQAIQWMLADMALALDASRLLVYRAAEMLNRGERATKEAAMAKLFTTEALNKAADSAVQIHGGMGYMREAGIERFYRDARITRIYEGTSEIQRVIIARELLREQ
ncbi:MAG: acyl-CoA dehydrogenase family protein [Betaproteobacteria bacterium]|nr:acyl-CoA dehydrogenase family protein [Betaproteobacteria bacterium]